MTFEAHLRRQSLVTCVYHQLQSPPIATLTDTVTESTSLLRFQAVYVQSQPSLKAQSKNHPQG